MYHHRLAPMLIWDSMMLQPSHCYPPSIIFSQHCIPGKSCVCVLLIQSCLTICKPVDYSLPGSSVHVILQARILEWTAIPFSRGSSRPTDWTQVSSISGRIFTVCFTIWATQEALQVIPLQCKSDHVTSLHKALMALHLILIKTQHLTKTYNCAFHFITAGHLSDLMLYFSPLGHYSKLTLLQPKCPSCFSLQHTSYTPLFNQDLFTFSLHLECFSM